MCVRKLEGDWPKRRQDRGVPHALGGPGGALDVSQVKAEAVIGFIVEVPATQRGRCPGGGNCDALAAAFFVLARSACCAAGTGSSGGFGTVRFPPKSGQGLCSLCGCVE